MFARQTILLLLALLPFQAMAADYDRAIMTSTVGGFAPVAGVALVGAAFAFSRGLDDDRQAAVGAGSALLALPLVVIGPPVLTGGAMQARKALSEQGVEVTNIPGWISWGCFTGVLLTGWAYPTSTKRDLNPVPFEIVQGSLFVAGYAAGIVQHGMVRQAHAKMPMPSGGVALVPMVDGGTMGVTVVGSF